jgi:hypothetical protein
MGNDVVGLAHRGGVFHLLRRLSLYGLPAEVRERPYHPGLVGIFMPFLWLIGAILPANPESLLDVAQR